MSEIKDIKMEVQFDDMLSTRPFKPSSDVADLFGIALSDGDTRINGTACVRTTRFGKNGDGSWFLCMDELYNRGRLRGLPISALPPYADHCCLVMSFGNRWEDTFERSLETMNCRIHIFDPSINMKSHQISPLVNFWLEALGDTNQRIPNPMPQSFKDAPKYWEIRTLDLLMSQLQMPRLDILKIDIEGAEWSVLLYLMDRTDLLRRRVLRQIVIEIHFGSGDVEISSQVAVLHRLQSEFGYRLINRDSNWMFSSVIHYRGQTSLDCFELSFVAPDFDLGFGNSINANTQQRAWTYMNMPIEIR